MDELLSGPGGAARPPPFGRLALPGEETPAQIKNAALILSWKRKCYKDGPGLFLEFSVNLLYCISVLCYTVSRANQRDF
jgi:hypothetical protein